MSVTLPPAKVASMSMPTTFSPMVRPVPASAEPMARPSQLFFATSVEPMPGMIHGRRNLTPSSAPKRTSRSTAGKTALSESASIPSAPTTPPRMVRSE